MFHCHVSNITGYRKHSKACYAYGKFKLKFHKRNHSFKIYLMMYDQLRVWN